MFVHGGANQTLAYYSAMFTGLVRIFCYSHRTWLIGLQIEHLGKVTAIKLDDGGCTLTISDSAPILDDCHIGDSIAVNGACLTVVEFDKEGWFTVWLANETLDKTDLGTCIAPDPTLINASTRRTAGGRSSEPGACDGCTY